MHIRRELLRGEQVRSADTRPAANVSLLSNATFLATDEEASGVHRQAAAGSLNPDHH